MEQKSHWHTFWDTYISSYWMFSSNISWCVKKENCANDLPHEKKLGLLTFDWASILSHLTIFIILKRHQGKTYCWYILSYQRKIYFHFVDGIRWQSMALYECSNQIICNKHILRSSIITRPKPAYGRQGLAGRSLRASGAQLGSGKWSFFVTDR